MRHLSRLGAIFAGFCLLGGAAGAFAQDGAGPSKAPSAFDPPAITELKIVRSSRKTVPDTIAVETEEIPDQPTRLYDQLGVMRLMGNEGVTLQWIDWDERGPVWVAVTQSGHWSLLGGQRGKDGAMLELEGFITEIGRDYFLYDGTIKIRGAPDADRGCSATKSWRFEVTQSRSYYRLREFEWCDDLTDYIDIYFPAVLK